MCSDNAELCNIRRFITSEGIAAAQDCVRALRALSNELPLPELTLSQGMTVAAKQGLPANSSFGTIRQFGRFEGRVVETCCFDQVRVCCCLLCSLITVVHTHTHTHRTLPKTLYCNC